MKAADLDQRITIKRQATGRDGAGQPSTTLIDVATVWADIRYKSGLESIKADANTSLVRASVRIRYIAGLTTAMQVWHGAGVFQIKAILPTPRRGYADLVCEAINVQT